MTAGNFVVSAQAHGCTVLVAAAWPGAESKLREVSEATWVPAYVNGDLAVWLELPQGLAESLRASQTFEEDVLRVAAYAALSGRFWLLQCRGWQRFPAGYALSFEGNRIRMAGAADG